MNGGAFAQVAAPADVSRYRIALASPGQMLNKLIGRAPRNRRSMNESNLGDRCAASAFVDMAVNTGLDDSMIDRIEPHLRWRLTSRGLVVLEERPRGMISRNRPDAIAHRHIARRRALCARLVATHKMPVVQNDGPARDALDQIIAIVEHDELFSRNQDHDLRLLQQ